MKLTEQALRLAVTEGFVKQFKAFDEALAGAILSAVEDLLEKAGVAIEKAPKGTTC